MGMARNCVQSVPSQGLLFELNVFHVLAESILTTLEKHRWRLNECRGRPRIERACGGNNKYIASVAK